jgi:formylglycine-generating enzyme required for sulfatase activity
MSGNVYEWQDLCDGMGTDRQQRCIRQGGAYSSTTAASLRCDATFGNPRDTRVDDTGFRCCWP